MKKLLFLLLVLVLLITIGCTNESLEDTQETDNQGYVSDLDEELDMSDLDLDNDLDLDWV